MESGFYDKIGGVHEFVFVWIVVIYDDDVLRRKETCYHCRLDRFYLCFHRLPLTIECHCKKCIFVITHAIHIGFGYPSWFQYAVVVKPIAMGLLNLADLDHEVAALWCGPR